MSYDTIQLRDWLAKDGGKFVGLDARPDEIRLYPNHTTLTAELRFAHRSTRLVLKEMPIGARKILGSNICQTHDRICRQSNVLSVSMPAFYSYHQSTGCVAMEYIPGATLLELLKLELSGRRPNEYNCENLIEQSATVLAEFHRLTPAHIGLAEATRSNASFVEGFQRMLTDSALTTTLRPVKQALRHVIKELGSSFLCRTDSRLLVHDAQPKNILVPGSNQVCFIDLVFLAGPPAMNLALFVTSLDRLSTRYFSSQAQSKISEWKQAFVKHYLRHTDVSEVANDYRFCYLWALVMTMHRHIGTRKWLRGYLSRRYMRQIRSALDSNVGLHIENATT